MNTRFLSTFQQNIVVNLPYLFYAIFEQLKDWKKTKYTLLWNNVIISLIYIYIYIYIYTYIYNIYTYMIYVNICVNTWIRDTYVFIFCIILNFQSSQTVMHNCSNALCSSDESVQIKHFEHFTFIAMSFLFTWFNLKILNFVNEGTSSLK